MRRPVNVKAVELFGVVDEILNQGGSAWITVTGMSMYPFLREGRDRVELSKTSFESVRKGDIVLIRRESGAYVLHRILRKDRDCFFIIGDAQQWVEGPIKPGQLKAVVTGIKKGNRDVDIHHPLHRIFVKVWMIAIPFRNKLFQAGRLGKRLICGKSKAKAQ